MSGGFYQVWPPSISGSGGGSGVNSIGSLDSQAASVNGASISGSVLYMQSASSASGGAGVGLVNTVQQAFLGNKVFVNQVLHSDGTSALPGMGFFSQPGIGWYRIGSADVGLSLGGAIAIEMLLVGSQTNFGFGAAASGALTNPLAAQANYNGTTYFQYNNFNTGSASATILQALSGTNANNYINLENYNNLLSGYLAGGSAVFSGPFQSQLNIGNESTSVNTYIAFNLNGRTLATEKVRLNVSNLTLNGGMQFIMTGSSSGAPALTQQAATSGTGYTFTWPGSQAAANSVLGNTSGGVGSWVQYAAVSGTNTLVQRDANGNSAANSFVSSTITTQSSGTSNIVLSAGSARIQKVIGSNTMVFTLPNATTLYSGQIYEFNNNSTQSVTIYNTGSTSIAVSVGGSYAYLICTDNSTANGVWDLHWSAPSSAIWGNNYLAVTGSITATSLTSAPVVSNSNGALTNGSISLTNQVVGVLPQGNLTLTPTFTQVTLGSVSQTSSSGGNAYTVTWPGTQGSSSASVFVNTGAGQCAWYPTGGMTVQTLSSTGTYTPRPGVVSIKVTVVGTGGSGGGSANTIGSQSSAGAGGGGGGAAIKWISLSSLSSSYSYSVARRVLNGGAGAIGTAATSSFFGSVAVATGGGGGGNSANGLVVGSMTAGGAGGFGAVGDINFSGGNGGPGIIFPASTGLIVGGYGGAGGASIFTSFVIPAPGGAGTSLAGTATGQAGAGGSGALCVGSGGASAAGGNSVEGTIIVEEYYY